MSTGISRRVNPIPNCNSKGLRQSICDGAKIISNKEIAPGHFRISFLSSHIANSAKPGQFVHIRVSDGYEPLLRRPFSIHRVTRAPEHQSTSQNHGRVEILYKVVGKGTKILSQKRPGDILDIIGPLGNGFNYPPSTIHYPLSLLVAGGVGIAPMLFLAEKMNEHQSTRAPEHQTLVLIGARTKDEVLCEKEFLKLGCNVKISTDDGSRGFKGKVTDLLKVSLSTIHYPLSHIYACGPRPMLEEISRISEKHNIPAQASLEAHMPCGVGVCLGCAIKVQGARCKVPGKEKNTTFHLAPSTLNDFEYKLVCKDGPVFNAGDILWE